MSFDIDPSVSKIEDENMKLVSYLKDRLLTIDIFDADSKFVFATAKMPMFEIPRQQKGKVVRAKEVEACAPDSQEVRASLQVIMQNRGRQDKQMRRYIEQGATEQQAAMMSNYNERE